MSAPPKSPGVPITDRRQLVEYHANGSKPPAAWRVGTEHEKFVFRHRDRRRAPYEGPDGIGALLNGMLRFGWEPVYEGDNIIALENDARCSITLEPGGQFELSGAPLETVHQTCDEVHEHLRQVREVCDELGLGMLGLGFDPTSRREDVGWMPKGRYRIMRDYMPKKGGHGLDMMLRTCTVQANLDYQSEADMVKKFRVSLALQPVAGGAVCQLAVHRRQAQRASRAYRSFVWTDTRPGPHAAPCRSCSRTGSALSAMSTTCSMCRCISSTATAITSTRAASRSAISSPGGCRRCRARSRR